MQSSHIYRFVHLSNQSQVKFDFVQIIAQYCHTSSPIPFFNNNKEKKNFFRANTRSDTKKRKLWDHITFTVAPAGLFDSMRFCGSLMHLPVLKKISASAEQYCSRGTMLNIRAKDECLCKTKRKRFMAAYCDYCTLHFGTHLSEWMKQLVMQVNGQSAMCQWRLLPWY